MKVKIISITIVAFVMVSCGQKLSQEMRRATIEYVDAVTAWMEVTNDTREIVAFEVGMIEALLGGKIKLLPYESYVNLQKAKAIAKKEGDLTKEELGFLAVWKMTVLTPVVLELLGRYAPDALRTLGLIL